ncbi:MAG TPA: hypothetical protein VN914_09505 [Polyangia bacterium]|nr:hypothetical protein [Polyangia bacterium]
MNRKHTIALFTVLQLSALGACASRPETRADSASLIAMGPSTGPAPSVQAPVVPPGKISDEVLHDPAARFAYTEQLRTQIVARTRGTPDARYWNEVRPALRRQIESAGLPRGDVDFLLWEIDQSRAAQ